MKSLVLLLGVMLVSPAWSQEPAATAPVATPRSFDRNDDSIRKIVRNAAAAQSVPIQPAEETPAKREPDAAFKYVPPEPKPVKAPAPTPRLPAAAPAATGPIGALIETLLEVEPDTSPEGRYNDWLKCQDSDNLKSVSDRYKTCPGVNRDGYGVVSGPPVPTPPSP